jgi:hypothetical protein
MVQAPKIYQGREDASGENHSFGQINWKSARTEAEGNGISCRAFIGDFWASSLLPPESVGPRRSDHWTRRMTQRHTVLSGSGGDYNAWYHSEQGLAVIVEGRRSPPHTAEVKRLRDADEAFWQRRGARFQGG